MDLESKLAELENLVGIKKQGKKTPSKEELLAGLSILLETQKGDKGDTPKKYIDYFTKEDLVEFKTEVYNEVAKLIKPAKDGEDGKTPTRAQLLSLIKPLIPQVKDGKTPTKSELKAITREVVDEVINGLDRRQLAIDTINFIETLEGDDRLDAKKLKNLQEAFSDIEIDAKKVKGLQDLLPSNPPMYAGGSGATFLKSLRDIINAKTASDGQALVKRGKNYQFETISGSGAVDSVNGQTGAVVLDADDIDDTSTTQKFVTSADLTKLSNLSGTNTGDVTVTDTDDIDHTLTGQALSSAIKATAISAKTLKSSLAGTEEVLINDAGTLKKTTAQDIADLGGGGGAPTGAEYVVLSTNGSLTNERVLTAGTGISVTDAGAGSTVTIASTITQYTDELAQDAVGGMVANSTFVSLAYNDTTPSLTPSLSATGTPSASTFLRGDNTWATPAGSGDVSKVGTPVNNQVGVWTGDGTLEGDTALTFDTTTNTLATEIVTVTDDAYGAGWNGSTAVPTKNAVYDKIESMGGGVTEAFVIAMATAL